MVRQGRSRKKADGPAPSSERRQEILDIAASLFAKRGYEAVTIREIAKVAGITGGSIYHHFDSKQNIFLEIHKASLENCTKAMRLSVEGIDDPWERLEIACKRHLEAQLDPASTAVPLMSNLHVMTGDMRKAIVRQRDAFEALYIELIDDLPMRPEIDRNLFRILLVSLINNIPSWYRAGKQAPDSIVDQVMAIFHGAAPSTAGGRTSAAR